MTENKHESEETVEDTAARVEAATATDVDTETPGEHAAVDETATAEEVEGASAREARTH